MNRLLAPLRLALQLLTHERRRLFACVGGISFALILMLLQVGFRSALLDSAVELLRQLDADIVVMDKEKNPFLSPPMGAFRQVGLSLENTPGLHRFGGTNQA